MACKISFDKRKNVMKNKTLKRVLCLLLVTVMAFTGLVGCDRGTQETSSGTSGEKLDLSGKMMDLIRDGSTEFVIVRNKEGSDYETDVAIDLKSRLEKITGAPMKLPGISSPSSSFSIAQDPPNGRRRHAKTVPLFLLLNDKIFGPMPMANSSTTI